MAKSQSLKKPPTGAPGARALITAASLAITLGGWATFIRANIDTTDTASPTPAIAIALPRPSTDLKFAPQLLPTIVPAPPLPPKPKIGRPPVISAALLSDSAPVAARVAAPRQQAAAPVAAQPAASPPEPPAAIQLPAAAPLPAVNAPPLRAVSPPPAPVARTRSSK
ncbi:MAG: hypothetical protein ABIV47_29075 [Roseiflexaceae bacterium]